MKTQPWKEQWELMSANVREDYLAEGFADPTTLLFKVKEEIKKFGSLAYLRSYNEDPAPIINTGPLSGSIHVGCEIRSYTILAGVKGFYFKRDNLSYSKYVWIHDEQYPAKGADIYKHGSYWTFVTIVEHEGKEVLFDAFKYIELSEKKIVGTLAS